MATIEITTTTEIPDEVLSYLVITAVEGGTGYWAQVSDYHYDDERPLDTFARLHEIDEMTGETDPDGMLLDTIAITRGLTLLSSVQPWRFARLTDPENDWDHDAEDADVIAQLALLGSITYG